MSRTASPGPRRPLHRNPASAARLAVAGTGADRRLERQLADRIGAGPDALGRAAIGQLAELQGGCVARWQLLVLGLTNSAIDGLTQREAWTSVHRGVWRLPGARDDALAAVWAAVLALAERDGPAEAAARMHPGADPLTVLSQVASDRAVVTAGTAAWALRLWRTPPAVPALLVDAAHHPERDGIRVIRTSLDRYCGATQLHGLWVAGLPRITWDVAWLRRRAATAAHDVADLVITADRMRLMPAEDLVALVDEPSQFALPTRVPVVLRQAAELVRPGFSHSRTEARGREIAAEVADGLGLTVHPRPLPIRKDGRIVAEADIAIVDLRVDIEIDGPHHRLFDQQARDRRRDGLLETIDWAVNRYDHELVDQRPADYAREVEDDLRRRMDEVT